MCHFKPFHDYSMVWPAMSRACLLAIKEGTQSFDADIGRGAAHGTGTRTNDREKTTGDGRGGDKTKNDDS